MNRTVNPPSPTRRARQRALRESQSIEGSAFFGLESRRTLARLLFVALPTLKRLAANAERNYYFCDKPSEKDPQKKRALQVPKELLMRVQKRILQLLQRIRPPDYLHSGVRGRSYHSNAAVHVGPDRWVGKLDIRNFFPSVKREEVFRFFRFRLQCSPDVADALTSLCICRGALPTGSPISQIVAFWTYEETFSAIASRAERHGLKMTLYVDDLGFSGAGVTKAFLRIAESRLKQRGLTCHKLRTAKPGKTLVLTGVAITPRGLRLPNERRRALARDVRALRNPLCKDIADLLQNVVGRCREASQFEPRYARLARKLSQREVAALSGTSADGPLP